LDKFAPGREQMLQRYKTANERDTLARKTVFKTAVTPGWIGASAFWYRNALPDSQSEFHFVDPVKNIKKPLFDHERMAKAIAGITGKPVSANRLPIRNVYLYPDGKKSQLL
jgi:hypothetical protein